MFDTVEEFWSQRDVDALDAHGECNADDFLEALKKRLGSAGRMWASPSARVAIQQFLSIVLTQERRRVLISSFNCKAVAQAALAAGAEVDTLDAADRQGRIDWEQAAERLTCDCAVVIVPHFFGIPSDFRPLFSAAARYGVFILEDCAQCVGGSLDGRVAGTMGDAAVFSFSYDKPLSLGGGGALLVNHPDLASRMALFHMPPDWLQEREEMKQFDEFLRARRGRAGWLDKLLGKTDATYQMAAGIGPLRAALGLLQLERFDAVVAQRNARAEQVLEVARKRFHTWHVAADARPTWVRQKVILANREQADSLSAILRRAGFRAGRYCWRQTVDPLLGRRPAPHSAHLAEAGVDLPIHQNLSEPAMRRMLDILMQI